MRELELSLLLARHGFHTSKALGQNFLIDDEVPSRIAGAAGLTKETHVLEIGPGIGALTRFLCENAGFVTAVELDKRLPPVLREQLGGLDNYKIIENDILKINLADLFNEEYKDFRVCANLPYNITSPVIIKLLESDLFESITIMIQREVAKRITALPGTSDYGAFSVFVQYHTNTERLFDVPPQSFIPVPKVTSAVIRLDILKEPPVPITDKTMFFRVVRSAFSQRRKTLANALTLGFSGISKQEITDVISKCGFDVNVRGETLGIPEFALLAETLKACLK